MTPSEALQLLSTASGLAALGRADHLKIMEAISILEKLLAEKKKD